MLLRQADVVVAGGMESMSRAPYLLDKGRNGYRMGHGQLFDHMMLDGLEDAYEGKAMGCYAQDTADKYGLDRDAMDNFAINSLEKAQAAIEKGYFKGEITPLTYSTRKGDVTVDTDEQPAHFRTAINAVVIVPHRGAHRIDREALIGGRRDVIVADGTGG